MSCIGCEYNTISEDDRKTWRAKCFFESKRGRTIIWASTTYESFSDAMIGKVGESGKARVISELGLMTKAPAWCKFKSTFNLIT